MASTSDPPVIDIPGYRLDRKLGEGGMGAVYLGTQLSIDRPVAIKLTPIANRSPKLIARFRREAKVLGRLSHPSIVQVIDAGQASGYLYMVMELVQGQSLGSLIRRGTRDVGRIARFVVEAAEGLATAHEAGIVHRDVKPDNILIDRRGWAKVADFGLARPEDDPALTAPGATLGTPNYMSPEQCRGQVAGPPADVYSLGVTLFEALTGRLPFAAPTPTALAERHVQQPAPPVRAYAPGVAPEIDRLVAQMLLKDPGARPTLKDVAAVLVRYAGSMHGGTPTPERPPTIAEPHPPPRDTERADRVISGGSGLLDTTGFSVDFEPCGAGGGAEARPGEDAIPTRPPEGEGPDGVAPVAAEEPGAAPASGAAFRGAATSVHDRAGGGTSLAPPPPPAAEPAPPVPERPPATRPVPPMPPVEALEPPGSTATNWGRILTVVLAMAAAVAGSIIGLWASGVLR